MSPISARRFGIAVCACVAWQSAWLVPLYAQPGVSRPGTVQEGPNPPMVKVYHLRYAMASEAEHVLQTLLSGADSTRLGVDERSNSIIILGTVETHDQVEALLQLLDREPEIRIPSNQRARNVQVEVFWIADVPNDEYAASAIPSSIADRVQTLRERLSIENPKLISRLFVQTLVDPQAGESESIEARGLAGNDSGAMVLDCQGSIGVHRDDGYRIDLMISVLIGESSSDVQSTILARPNRPICLALADTTSLKSMFVVLVTEDE